MFQIECRLRGVGDTYRWHLARALPEHGGTGQIAGWLGTFTDIEDQKRAAEFLAEFKGTLDAVLDAVMIFEAHSGHFLYVNHGTEALLGRSSEELLQMRLVDLLVEYDEEKLRALLAPLEHDAEKAVLEETRCRRKDGTEIPIEMSFQLIRVDGGRLVAIARDITDRKLAELEREHLYNEAVTAVRARDDFLSVASHELRGPLSALVLRLETLVRAVAPRHGGGGGTAPEQMHERLRAAARQADRLAQLVSELLDVSRITAGKLHLQPRPADLVAITNDVIGRFKEEAAKAHSTIDLHAEAPVNGRWDPLRIEQVITNLVSNAVKFGAGKPVDVTVSGTNGSAQLVVRDRGIGIAPDDLQRIFHRFERAAAAKTYAGLGMGLYIVRQIVEAHGGQIRAESQPDAGAAFVVDLPRETPADAAA
jgi:PAS domain S-box-containing protein